MSTGRRAPRRKSGRPPQADSDRTRARILETASASFALHGYADTPVSAVAAAAGVTPGTLYYHFGSKAALYAAVAAQARARLNERLIEPVLAVVADEASLTSRLTTLVNVLVHRAGEDITLHRLGFASDLEADQAPAVAAFRDGMRDDLHRLYAGVAGVPATGELTDEHRELVGFIETVTLGVWHFGTRPNGLERLPVVVQAFQALLHQALFAGDPQPARAGALTARP
jgi:AcrR family transcriptional regulator